LLPPRSPTSCSFLPPEGAGLARGGPSRRPLPPRSPTSCSFLPPEGAGLARGGPSRRPLPPRSLTSCSFLPPEGAGLARGGPSRRPLTPRSLTSCSFLHLAGRRSPAASLLSPVQTCSSRFGAAGSSPKGAGLAWGGPSRRPLPSRLFNSCSLPLPEGAAAPADWQSQIRGPSLA